MMRNKTSESLMKVLFLAFAFQFLAFNCFAGGPGTTGAAFLKLGTGARPSAMGEAFSAVAGDVNSIYWNPAGLAYASDKQISFVHTEWLQSVRYEYLAYCQPAFGGTIGTGITYLYIDGIERRTGDTPNPDGIVPANDLSVAVSYSKGISDKASLGGSVKILRQQLDDLSSMGAAFDIGLLIKPGEDVLCYGLCLQNIGYMAPFITEANLLPLNLKAGISRSIQDKFTFAADLNYSILDSVWAVGAGIEYWLVPMFSLRAGYKYNSAINTTLGALTGLTCGIGFRLNILGIDYAFVPYGDLGYTHRIALGAKF